METVTEIIVKREYLKEKTKTTERMIEVLSMKIYYTDGTMKHFAYEDEDKFIEVLRLNMMNMPPKKWKED